MRKKTRNRVTPIDLVALEKEIKRIISEGSEMEYTEWYTKSKPILMKKFLNRPDYYPSALKQVVRNVLYQNTMGLPKTRIVQLFNDIPFMNRFYFGSELNHEIYDPASSLYRYYKRIQNRVRRISYVINTQPKEKEPKQQQKQLPVQSKGFMNRIKAFFAEIVSPLKTNIFTRLKSKPVFQIGDLHIKRFHFEYQKPPPKFENIVDLAYFFNMNINQIWKYCFMNSTDIKHHDPKKPVELSSPFYNHILKTKANGRKRLISVPHPELKKMQQKILHDILYCVRCPSTVTAFIPGRSIVTNAKFHLDANTLVKLDLKDFFPSLKLHHVRQVFLGLGYNQTITGILACLCTDFYRNSRFVPQGSPTSPMIANLYATNLDNRLNKLWGNKGFRYSRYADDLTFSSIRNDAPVQKTIKKTQEIILEEGLQPNLAKTKIFRKGNQLQVTGIVINKKLNPKHDWEHKLRASLHHAKYVSNMSTEELIALQNQIRGKIAFLKMINPQKALKYDTQFRNIFPGVKINQKEE